MPSPVDVHNWYLKRKILGNLPFLLEHFDEKRGSFCCGAATGQHLPASVQRTFIRRTKSMAIRTTATKSPRKILNKVAHSQTTP